MADKLDILIAEDSRIQAKMLQRRLEAAGYAVRWAENGRIALEMTRQQRPDLIISDIEMPEMSGYEYCQAVKSDPELRTIPLILLSTLSEAEDIIRGLHVSADNYVTKPYEASYLISRMEDLLRTPIVVDESDLQILDVHLAGKRYQVKAGKQQVLNLLVSTFENAVEKNTELVKSNEALSLARDQLSHSNSKLLSLNAELETANSRMANDLAAAAKIQQCLLPTTLPELPQARFAWRYVPCDELAGDFLNILRLDDQHLALFVVDVSGHGVASSLLAVTIGRVLTAQLASGSLLIQKDPDSSEVKIVPPAKVAFELNNRFPMEAQGNLYFTMVYGILNLETYQFRYVSAGHPSIAYLPVDGPPRLLEAEGLAIGWMEDVEFDECTLQLKPGDRLFLYSDGVPEAMDHDLTELGNEQMMELMTQTKSMELDNSVEYLLQAVQKWCRQKGPKDDISILAMDVAGPSC